MFHYFWIAKPKKIKLTCRECACWYQDQYTPSPDQSPRYTASCLSSYSSWKKRNHNQGNGNLLVRDGMHSMAKEMHICNICFVGVKVSMKGRCLNLHSQEYNTRRIFTCVFLFNIVECNVGNEDTTVNVN